MSFVDTYFRHQCIIGRLKKGYASLAEIEDYYQWQCDLTNNVFIFSERTFCRDKDLMLCAYGVEVKWCRVNRKYFIDQ